MVSEGVHYMKAVELIYVGLKSSGSPGMPSFHHPQPALEQQPGGMVRPLVHDVCVRVRWLRANDS
jgi:hypothetical protein